MRYLVLPGPKSGCLSGSRLPLWWHLSLDESLCVEETGVVARGSALSAVQPLVVGSRVRGGGLWWAPEGRDRLGREWESSEEGWGPMRSLSVGRAGLGTRAGQGNR